MKTQDGSRTAASRWRAKGDVGCRDARKQARAGQSAPGLPTAYQQTASNHRSPRLTVLRIFSALLLSHPFSYSAVCSHTLRSATFLLGPGRAATRLLLRYSKATQIGKCGSCSALRARGRTASIRMLGMATPGVIVVEQSMVRPAEGGSTAVACQGKDRSRRLTVAIGIIPASGFRRSHAPFCLLMLDTTN